MLYVKSGRVKKVSKSNLVAQRKYYGVKDLLCVFYSIWCQLLVWLFKALILNVILSFFTWSVFVSWRTANYLPCMNRIYLSFSEVMTATRITQKTSILYGGAVVFHKNKIHDYTDARGAIFFRKPDHMINSIDFIKAVILPNDKLCSSK